MSDATGNPQQLALSALRAWGQGEFDRAHGLARRAIALAPDEPNARQVLGAIAMSAGSVEEAAEHFRVADHAAPNQPQILNMLAKALQSLGDLSGARASYARAGALGLAEAWRGLGKLEAKHGDPKAAIEALERAALVAPKNATILADLAQALENRHDLDRAMSLAEASVQIDPKSEIALLTIAQIHMRRGSYGDVRAAVETVLQSNSATNRALAIGLAGESYDREGRSDEAFAAFTAANQILLARHRAMRLATASPFHPTNLSRLLRSVAEGQPQAWVGPTHFEQPAPVFLVGFPRSGTTLLDQILSSHSEIVCLDETEILAETIADLLAASEAPPRWMSLSENEILERRGKYFKRAVEALRAPIRRRVFIDKLPLNLLFLPLVARIFPDARIIFALRDPRDVVLSCYQQRFSVNASMVWLLEFSDAARYYDLAMSLFMASKHRFRLACAEVRYERLVVNLESVARELTAFLGLDFEPTMLDYAATARRRSINTPSLRQVVQPLYTRSVGRWRSYSRHFAPIAAWLDPWVQRFGYEPW